MQKSRRYHSTRVYEELRDEIITCFLPPGSMIFEQALADYFQVSKTPVREALKRLSQDGLVEGIHGVGYRVSTITVPDVQEIFEMRLILEKASAEIAAERISEGQLAALSRLAEESAYAYNKYETYASFLEANRKFHLSVAAISRNSRLLSALEANLLEMERLLHLELDLRDDAEEMRQEHLALVRALKEGDKVKAVEVMSAQILTSCERVLDAILAPLRAGGREA